MSETLNIFGSQFTGVTGIKATNSSNQTLTYIIPQGNISINSNGSNIDVTNYATANVSVGSTLPTQHTINLAFSDNTDTDIDVYYSDSLIGTMITAYEPSSWTYNNKTVYVAELDNVEWYDATPSAETWETLFDANEQLNSETPYNGWWIEELADVQIPQNSVWRVTLNGVVYRLTASYYYSAAYSYGIGNPKWSGGTDDGTDVPFTLVHTPWGAWSGNADLLANTPYPLKIERLVTT